MYIPTITSIETALKVFYENAELGNREIKELFGSRSSATVAKLKKLVKAEMGKREMPSFGFYKINTAIAFEIWGINIADLEQRRKKIKELSL